MNKICTNVEQSQKFIELGIDISTADMFYKYVLPKSDKIHHIPEIGNPINSLKWYNEGYTFRGRKEPITLNEYCIPAWSLSALLNIMPQTIDKEDKWLLRLQRCYNRNVTKFICTYPNTMSTSICDNPVDACVEMILKLKEKGLL